MPYDLDQMARMIADDQQREDEDGKVEEDFTGANDEIGYANNR